MQFSIAFFLNKTVEEKTTILFMQNTQNQKF